jgi:hypothetical protein
MPLMQERSIRATPARIRLTMEREITPHVWARLEARPSGRAPRRPFRPIQTVMARSMRLVAPVASHRDSSH